MMTLRDPGSGILSKLAFALVSLVLLTPRAAADLFVPLASQQGSDLHAQVRARVMTELVTRFDQSVARARGFAEDPPADRVLMLPDFCPGCATAHYWMVNPHDTALFALEVKIEMADGDGQDAAREQALLRG